MLAGEPSALSNIGENKKDARQSHKTAVLKCLILTSLSARKNLIDSFVILKKMSMNFSAWTRAFYPNLMFEQGFLFWYFLAELTSQRQSNCQEALYEEAIFF
jgi:hypothetical protein